MNDFTLKKYEELLDVLQNSGYQFIQFRDYLKKPMPQKFVMLRHDVDIKAVNSLRTAKSEFNRGITGSYYFRVVPASNKPEIITSIASLGHEIGYHYEDLAICNGDLEKAYAHFCGKLEYFRVYYPVETICMHGSPVSKYDNRTLWKHYDYRALGIIGEPYFDVDFSQVFYLTDTGRCWDGEGYSVRDKVESTFTNRYHSTNDIISAALDGSLPDKMMITIHPQRWTNNSMEWVLELIGQSVKNVIKSALIKIRKPRLPE